MFKKMSKKLKIFSLKIHKGAELKTNPKFINNRNIALLNTSRKKGPTKPPPSRRLPLWI